MAVPIRGGGKGRAIKEKYNFFPTSKVPAAIYGLNVTAIRKEKKIAASLRMVSTKKKIGGGASQSMSLFPNQ